MREASEHLCAEDASYLLVSAAILIHVFGGFLLHK